MEPRPSIPPRAPGGLDPLALTDRDEGAMDAIRRELDRQFPNWAGVPDAPPPVPVAAHGLERAGQRWIAVGALLLAFVAGGAAGVILATRYPAEPVASPPVVPLPPAGALAVSPLPVPAVAPPGPQPGSAPRPRTRPQNPSATDGGTARAPRAGGAAAIAPAPPPPRVERGLDALEETEPAPARTGPAAMPEAP